MPVDTTIRDGVMGVNDEGDWSVTAPLAWGLLRRDVPCVVVTGRTAQETREAFELLDNRNRIFPGCVRDA